MFRQNTCHEHKLNLEVDRKRLEAFEIWGYRSVLKIKWMDRISNKKVLEESGDKKTVE